MSQLAIESCIVARSDSKFSLVYALIKTLESRGGQVLSCQAVVIIVILVAQEEFATMISRAFSYSLLFLRGSS